MSHHVSRVLHDFRDAFASVPQPAVTDVTPETRGDIEHVKAIREFQRSLRECRPPNPAPEEV